MKPAIRIGFDLSSSARRLAASLVIWAALGCTAPAERPPLQDIPRPETDHLGAAMSTHVLDAQAAWELGRADPDLGAESLAQLAADYARAAHLYELWSTADAAYRNAVALDPEDFELNYVFATFLGLRGQPEEALQRLLRVRDQRPEFLPLRVAVLEAQLDLGNLEAARQEAEAGIAEAPDEPGLHFLHGQVLLSEANWTGAIDAFDRTLELDPNTDAAHRGLATAYAALGDAVRAAHHRGLQGSRRPGIRDDILGALGKESRDTLRLERRAEAAFRRGNARVAAALLLQAHEMDPERHRINIALAVAFNRIDQPQRAREILETHLERDLDDFSRAIGLVNLGHAKARLGLENEAIQDYREALRLSPGVPNARLNLGTLLCRRPEAPQDRAEALKLLEQAYVQQPSGNAAVHLAVCRRRAENTASALITLRAAVADRQVPATDHAVLRLAELRIELADDNTTPADLEAALQRAEQWFQRTRRVEFLEMGIHALAKLGRRDAALANVDAALQAVVGAGRQDLQLRLEETQSRIVDALVPLSIDPLDA